MTPAPHLPASCAGTRLRSVLALGILASLPGFSTASEGRPLYIDTAVATLMPDGLPPERRGVALRHRWEKDYPGRGGRADYHITLPPHPDIEPSALLLERTGNQLEIRVNGQVLQRIGRLGDPNFDALKADHLVEIPSQILSKDTPNSLEIRISTQALRAAGLGRVSHGPLSVIGPLHEQREFWLHDLPRVYAISLLLMGALSLTLWWRQRDALYGYFSIAAFGGSVRVFDQIAVHAPLGWPLWGMFVSACYAIHLCFVAHFILLALGSPPKHLTIAINASLALVLGLVAASFSMQAPFLWTGGLAILLSVGMCCYACVIHDYIRSRRPLARALALAGTAAIACGIHDLFLVRIGIGALASYPLMPHSVFFFVLILAGIVVDRYSKSILAVQELNASLAERIAEREKQLTEVFAVLHRQREEQALFLERQRIMRELHDGIGSQLVGMLNLVEQKIIDPAQLSEHLQIALDEMRIAVDSLQPIENDLTVVLANLRYRLQPRLVAAGLGVVWDVPNIPALPRLPPQAILHLQRIVREAFTNILKHARATRVAVTAHCGGVPYGVRIDIADDGVGLPKSADSNPEQHFGHGIANMHARATAIGAALRVFRSGSGGTCVSLEWPIPPGET